MSAAMENQPERDPVWERTRILHGIRECLEKNQAIAQYRITDQLDVLTILQGDVEPFTSGNTRHYENMRGYVVGKAAIDGTLSAVIAFGNPASRPYSYELVNNVASLVDMSGNNADSENLFMLSRTVFSRTQSSVLAFVLFDPPILSSQWHNLLRLEPQMPPAHPRDLKTE